MLRAKPNKRNLSEVFIKKLTPQPRKFAVWDTKQRNSGRPRPADRFQIVEVRLFPCLAVRAGFILASLGRF